MFFSKAVLFLYRGIIQLLLNLFLSTSYFYMVFKISLSVDSFGASLVVQVVKNLPAMQETTVWSLGWEDPLEKEMATCSSILAWRVPWTEEPGRLWGRKESDTTERLTRIHILLDFLNVDYHCHCHYHYLWGFPGHSVVKNPPANKEMQVQSLVGENPWRRKW